MDERIRSKQLNCTVLTRLCGAPFQVLRTSTSEYSAVCSSQMCQSFAEDCAEEMRRMYFFLPCPLTVIYPDISVPSPSPP
jgi:hypothetical protein